MLHHAIYAACRITMKLMSIELMSIDGYKTHPSTNSHTTPHSARHIRHRYAMARQDRLARDKVVRLIFNNINLSSCMTRNRVVRYIRNGVACKIGMVGTKPKYRMLLARSMARGMSRNMLQYVAMLYVHRHITIGPHNVITAWSLVRRGIAVIDGNAIRPA